MSTNEMTIPWNEKEGKKRLVESRYNKHFF